MNITDLIKHTEETIILDGPEAWKQTDYLANARRAGLSLNKAVELANTAVTEVNKHQDRIKRFQNNVIQEYERRPTDRRHVLLDERLLSNWLADLQPLQLSETFVRDRWIPALIAQLPFIATEPVEKKTTSPKPIIPTPVSAFVPPPQPGSRPVVREFTATPEGDRSRLYVGIFAVALLALIYWFINNSNTTQQSDREPKPTERPTINQSTEETAGTSRRDLTVEDAATELAKKDSLVESVEESTATASSGATTNDTLTEQSPTEQQAAPESTVPPTTPDEARKGRYNEAFGDKPYDKVEIGADERGWRRARSKGRWGYVNEADEWMLPPEYEAVTRFRGNIAAVFLNGQLMNINREGEQIRK